MNGESDLAYKDVICQEYASGRAEFLFGHISWCNELGGGL